MNSELRTNHIHFIGICGVAMSALAIMMQKKGPAKSKDRGASTTKSEDRGVNWKVTGSDVGFYPPISTHLKKHKIEYYPGWHPERIGAKQIANTPLTPLNRRETMNKIPPVRRVAEGWEVFNQPDLVVVGNVAGSTNPEFLFVQENNIPYVSYPEFIEKYLIKKNSIVCAGTYGKTSTSALLSYILKNANYKPAYMFGGLSNSLDSSADDLGGDWSVVEGDEYKTSRWEETAKFFHYSPTHLLLTAVKWDHADVYPTPELYFEAFQKLINGMPAGSLIVANEGVVERLKDWKIKRLNIITYGQSESCNYQYYDVKTTKEGLKLKIKHKSSTLPTGRQVFNLQSSMIGDFQAENICGAFAMAHQIGISGQLSGQLITQFKGIKRRLEIRGKTKSGATVIDDIAHSPDKVKSVLETLKNIYDCHSERSEESTDPSCKPQDDKCGKVICVFEPNSGNRKKEAKKTYKNAFNLADEVIIPSLTKIKNDIEFLTGKDLSNIIKKDNPNTKYIDDDENLIKYLEENTNSKDVIIFCGSHSFRGMIDEIIK